MLLHPAFANPMFEHTAHRIRVSIEVHGDIRQTRLLSRHQVTFDIRKNHIFTPSVSRSSRCDQKRNPMTTITSKVSNPTIHAVALSGCRE